MRSLLLVLALLVPVPTFAQSVSTQQDIQARVLHKPLYLRGMWGDNKLQFDANGRLIGSSESVSFTLSGIDVHKVKLGPDGLELSGIRIGLKFKGLTPERIPLESIHAFGSGEISTQLKIASPSSGDYAPALDAILAKGLEDLAPGIPDYWQGFVRTLIDPASDQAGKKGLPPPGVTRVGGNVTPPKVLSMPDPDFNEFARALRISGLSLIYLQADESGRPMKLRVMRAIGLGLDERALQAVGRYKFSPALRDGKPVIVELVVSVKFKIS